LELNFISFFPHSTPCIHFIFPFFSALHSFSSPRSVVCLQLKPTNEEVLLIGYENGTIVEWDLRARRVVMIYLYANPDTV
jgi:hypothetical protein